MRSHFYKSRANLLIGRTIFKHGSNIEDAKSYLRSAIETSKSDQSDGRLNSIYFEASSVLAEVLISCKDVNGAIQLLTGAIENAKNDNFWHLKLIFQLSVSFKIRNHIF